MVPEGAPHRRRLRRRSSYFCQGPPFFYKTGGAEISFDIYLGGRSPHRPRFYHRFLQTIVVAGPPQQIVRGSSWWATW